MEPRGRLRALAAAQGTRARRRRAELFRRSFEIGPETRILDLGSEAGDHIAAVLEGCGHRPRNVFIADIDPGALERGRERHGFTPAPIPAEGRLPFDADSFDVVFCSSVIEHVTVPKDEVWRIGSQRAFRERARHSQAEFAAEVRRIARQYWVQTPNRWFPLESHTLLPLAGYLPRPLLLPVMRASNRYWIKRTQPDWHLLTAGELGRLFPDARIARERFLGLTKSLIAISAADRSGGRGEAPPRRG